MIGPEFDCLPREQREALDYIVFADEPLTMMNLMVRPPNPAVVKLAQKRELRAARYTAE